MVAIGGTVARGYESLREVFAAGFDGKPAMGAALCVRREGETVVDLWGGVADARDGRGWAADTPSVVFSCTKGLVSILVAQLVEQGRLDYDAPVSRYWPEFAQGGKEAVTVGTLLSHRAGLSAPRADLSEDDLVDWDRMVTVLAAQEPLWPPGEGFAYHALTFGWLAGELVRRVSGQSVGARFAQEIAGPLGVDAWIGLPAERQAGVAQLQVSPALQAVWDADAHQPAPNWPFRAMTLGHAVPQSLVTPDGGFNKPRIRAAEIPGAGGIATARALATIWSATVVETDGRQRLLGDAVIAEATKPRSGGVSVFGGEPPFSSWGYGFQRDAEARPLLNDRCFGHDGAGGQVAFADPVNRIGVGYVTNWMMGADDRRGHAVVSALRALL